MGHVLWGSIVAVALLLALAPPATARHEPCEAEGLTVSTCGHGPFVHFQATPDTAPLDGLDMRGNVTACTGGSEPECWEDGGPRAAATLAWEAHVRSGNQSFSEQPRACAEVPFPTAVALPVAVGPEGLWDPLKVGVCIYDGHVHPNGCWPIGPDTLTRFGPELP